MQLQLKREKERRSTDSNYHTALLLRQRLRGMLKQAKGSKRTQTLNLIGTNLEDVKQHIDSQWDTNRGTYDIDHVFPFRFYDIDSEQGQRTVMHYSNMQPLSGNENKMKSDKLPTKAMAAKVDRDKWPPGITEDMLPDIYPGWSTPLRM